MYVNQASLNNRPCSFLTACSSHRYWEELRLSVVGVTSQLVRDHSHCDLFSWQPSH